MNSRKNQFGFSVIEALLLLVIVGILAGTGWYVWNASSKASDTLAKADAANSSSLHYPANQMKKNNLEKTESTREYKSKSNLFSIQLPDGWKFYHQYNDVLLVNSIDMIDKAGQPATVTETGGGGDGLDGLIIAQDERDLSGQRFNNQYQNIGVFQTNSGMFGNKYLYEQTTDPTGIGMPKGGKEFSYYFLKNNKGIYIAYTLYPSEANHLDSVEKMIKTLQ